MPRDSTSTTGAAAGASPVRWTALPAAFAPQPTAPRLSARWLLARLRTMSADELGSRAWRSLRNALRPPARRRIQSDRRWLPAPLPLTAGDRDELICDAREILRGRYPLLGRWIDAGAHPTWAQAFAHHARHGTAAELSPAEDVRYLLELNRHGHLVCLAQAWHATRDRRFANRIADHLRSWNAECTPGTGPAWSSPIEPAMRLVQWSLACQWLGAGGEAPPVTAAVRDLWRAAVASHVEHVARRLSSHSSANNHLIAELAGLVVAAATWPEAMRGSAADKAVAGLQRELLAQHSADGVNREQALAYQVFVFDLYLVARQAAASLGRPFGAEVDRRMAQSARFVAALRNARGELPALGDSDDAGAVRWSRATPAARAGRVIALAAAVGIAPELAALADPAHPALRWLALPPPALGGDPLEARRRLPRRFDDGGHYLLGADFGGAREVLVRVDCGPLGYLRIAAHGHADALAVTLAIGGHEILVDRGTFTYNARPTLRPAFRGTLMHNTVTVDGRDQSAPAGPFIWLRHARAHCESFSGSDEAAELTGVHDGYQSLADPVRHSRRVCWDAAGARLTVADRLSAASAHEIAVAWHFSPACALQRAADQLIADTPAARLRVAAHAEDEQGREVDTLHWLLPSARPEAAIGWHAPVFGLRQPAPTAVYAGPIAGSVRVVTTFEIEWQGSRP
jgi:hypothetical protein